MTSLASLSLAIGLLTFAAKPAHAATDVYLFGGQSNMVSGIVDGFVTRMQTLDPAADLATSRYRNPGVGLDSGWTGLTWLGDPPGTGRTNFYAGTGSSDPNIGTAYNAMLSTWQADLASISGPYEIKGIIWVQGEQDTKQTTSVGRYAASLDNLQTRIHEDLALTLGSVEFYYSSMESTYSGYTYADDLRNQQLIADKNSGDAAAISNANWIDASGLAYEDAIGVHYDAASQTVLGERFANAVVPEPTSLTLLGLGGLCLIKRRRRG